MKTLVDRIVAVVLVVCLLEPSVFAVCETCNTGAPSIDSPDMEGQLDHDANVSCKGVATEEGISWSCKITDADTKWNKVTGSATCDTNCDPEWSGTVSKPSSQNWTPGTASVAYSEDGQEVESHEFEFVNNS
jgi:hypothetical protein